MRNLLPKIHLRSFIRPKIVPWRILLKFFNQRSFMFKPCASRRFPIFSTASPMRIPHLLLVSWNWISKVPSSSMSLTTLESVLVFSKILDASPIYASFLFRVSFFCFSVYFLQLIRCKSFLEQRILDFFWILWLIFFNLSKYTTELSINFHFSRKWNVRIGSSRLIIKVLLRFFIRPFWTFVFHLSAWRATISCIFSTTSPLSYWIIFLSSNEARVTIAFGLFWIVIFSFPFRNLWPCYIILSTEPIWIRRYSKIRSMLRINLAMIHTKFWWWFFWSTSMLTFSTARRVPRLPTTWPAFWPESHPGSKLINTRMMLTRIFLIFTCFIFNATTPFSANHCSIIAHIVDLISRFGLFLNTFWDSTRIFMHPFIKFDFWICIYKLLLSYANFIGISILHR